MKIVLRATLAMLMVAASAMAAGIVQTNSLHDTVVTNVKHISYLMPEHAGGINNVNVSILGTSTINAVSVTDTAGNKYTEVSHTSFPRLYSLSSWTATDIKAVPMNTVTVTISEPWDFAINIFEFSL
jgi:hypothetical protein